MKISFKSTVLVSLLISGLSQATEFNHGNHDDPIVYGMNSVVDTLECGSMSLSQCTDINNTIKPYAKELCQNVMHATIYDNFYYHSHTVYGITILSISLMPATVNYEFSCQALRHSTLAPPRRK